MLYVMSYCTLSIFHQVELLRKKNRPMSSQTAGRTANYTRQPLIPKGS